MTQAVPLATISEPGSGIGVQALRRAAVRATLAPSVHNTQPWHFTIADGALGISADFTRQLRALDPIRRQLLISCGCAILNARASLASDGYAAALRRSPDPLNGQPLGRLTDGGSYDPRLSALDPAIQLRRTNRQPFTDDAVGAELIDLLLDAARREGAELHPIRNGEDRELIAMLSRRADAHHGADPGYRAELRAWIGGGLGKDERSSANQCLLLLGSAADHPHDWLTTGQALERVWLEVTLAGYALCPLIQVVEVAGTRALLRSELGLAMHPQVLLSVGRAPATPMSRRRKLVEVIRETPPDAAHGE